MTSPKKLSPAAAMTALLMALGLPATAVPDSLHELVSTVGKDGKLEGCGVRVGRPDGATASVTLHREDTRDGRGPLELSATLPGLTALAATIRLSTANGGLVDAFAIDETSSPGAIHATAHIESDAAALLMHDVLLQGFALSVGTGGEDPRDETFPGPATPDIIRGYLQCAGNMGR